MSSFSWLDYSEQERRQAIDVIDLFREEDTRDELGLGTIRDPLSDLLFPGTSTIQTRARYFLFIPWVYRTVERRKPSASEWPTKLRQLQRKIRDALITGGEDVGVIGFRTADVQRLPSGVYWAGLKQWGILRFRGSEEDLRRFHDTQRCADETPIADGGESLDLRRAIWDPHLPDMPEALFDRATFELTTEEAEYLVQHIAERFPRSAMAHLLLTRQNVNESAAYVWDQVWAESPPAALAGTIKNARNFSEVMHGAALVYNLLLAEAKPGGEYVPLYREKILGWRDKLGARAEALSNWDRAAFWQLILANHGRVPLPTRHFVDAWLDIVLGDSDRSGLADRTDVRALVTERERRLKRGRARIGNARAVEIWGGAAGSAQMDYRWNRPVRAIMDDILEPLTGGRSQAPNA